MPLLDQIAFQRFSFFFCAFQSASIKMVLNWRKCWKVASGAERTPLVGIMAVITSLGRFYPQVRCYSFALAIQFEIEIAINGFWSASAKCHLALFKPADCSLSCPYLWRFLCVERALLCSLSLSLSKKNLHLPKVHVNLCERHASIISLFLLQVDAEGDDGSTVDLSWSGSEKATKNVYCKIKLCYTN